MNTLKKIIVKILHPGRFLSVVIILSGFGLLACVSVTGQRTSFPAYLSYILADYALLIPAANALLVFRKIRRRLEANPYAGRWFSEPEYRARTSLYAGLLIDFAYIVFKAALGIYYRSVWYKAVAVYYIVLSAIRFFLAQNDRKKPSAERTWRCYRLTGISLLFLNMAMTGTMVQMIRAAHYYYTIMPSFAPEESRSISENVTWGQRKRFADSKVSFAYSRVLGLDKDKDTDRIKTNPEQAETVRLIFRLFLEGTPPHSVAAELTRRSIKTLDRKDVWNQQSVRRMLSNEKYKDDALLQFNLTLKLNKRKSPLKELKFCSIMDGKKRGVGKTYGKEKAGNKRIF